MTCLAIPKAALWGDHNVTKSVDDKLKVLVMVIHGASALFDVVPEASQGGRAQDLSNSA